MGYYGFSSPRYGRIRYLGCIGSYAGLATHAFYFEKWNKFFVTFPYPRNSELVYLIRMEASDLANLIEENLNLYSHLCARTDFRDSLVLNIKSMEFEDRVVSCLELKTFVFYPSHVGDEKCKLVFIRKAPQFLEISLDRDTIMDLSYRNFLSQAYIDIQDKSLGKWKRIRAFLILIASPFVVSLLVTLLILSL